MGTSSSEWNPYTEHKEVSSLTPLAQAQGRPRRGSHRKLLEESFNFRCSSDDKVLASEIVRQNLGFAQSSDVGRFGLRLVFHWAQQASNDAEFLERNRNRLMQMETEALALQFDDEEKEVKTLDEMAEKMIGTREEANEFVERCEMRVIYMRWSANRENVAKIRDRVKARWNL